MHGIDRTQLIRTALLGLATVAAFLGMGLWDAVGGTAPSDGVRFAVLIAVLVVATATAVWHRVPVPAAVLVVPLAAGATIMVMFAVWLALGGSDGQAALVPVVGVVLALLLVPFTGAVAGLTMAVHCAVRRRTSAG